MTNDDAEGLDARLVTTVTADGSYLVSITDAQDTGSLWHGYELSLKRKPMNIRFAVLGATSWPPPAFSRRTRKP